MRKNKQHMKIFIALGFLMAINSLPLAAFSNHSTLHTRNPALLSTSRREFFELSFLASPGVTNSYFSPSNILKQEMIIDLSQIYSASGAAGFRAGGSLNSGSHTSLHIGPIGLAGYWGTQNLARVTVPKEMLGILANGNEIGQTYEGNGDAFINSFVEYGGYASYRWQTYTFGLKAAGYLPLAYTRNGRSTITFSTAESGAIDVEAGMNAELYSVVDLENPDSITSMDATSIMSLLTEHGGIKLDFGLIHNPERNRPEWGLALINIPVIGALPNLAWQFSATTSAGTAGLLTGLSGGTEEAFEMSEPELEFGPLAEATERIYMPFRIGGFYRFRNFPVVDIIPHAEVVIAEPFRFNAGVSVEGTRFPWSLFAAGLAYEEIAWQANLDMRFDMRFAELMLRFSTNSPELLGVFSGRGARFQIETSYGF